MTAVALGHVDAGVRLMPDPARVLARFFVPGQEDVGPGGSRAALVVKRIMGLSDAEVTAAMDDIDDRFSGRHLALDDLFERHLATVAERVPLPPGVTGDRRRLLGAAFTHEYSIEGAALCNPSIVRHPKQPGNGDIAVVLSVRGIGEGHRSSIGFRTGTVTTAGTVAVDHPGPRPVLGVAASSDADDGSGYRVTFPSTSALSERVLWPHLPAEHHGMEDARFVEITDGSAPRYCATYTAFDGTHIAQHLLTTENFATFTIVPMTGAAAVGKGLALFPRRINGRHMALTRADRETNSIASSDDLRRWDGAAVLQRPRRSWEVLQLGNCGSPIETPDGWLVLTHGVGAMRTYAIGALLLDLDEPQRVVAASEQPLLAPTREYGGYVPNVVYSCGAIAVADRLVLPYGHGDQTIAVASFSIRELVAAMTPL